MLLAEFSISPMDKGASVGAYVARCVDVIDRSGLAYRLGPMGTCVEGDFDAVMAVIQECHAALEKDCDRITTSIKLDWRRGRSGALEGKVRSVEERLGRAPAAGGTQERGTESADGE